MVSKEEMVDVLKTAAVSRFFFLSRCILLLGSPAGLIVNCFWSCEISVKMFWDLSTQVQQDRFFLEAALAAEYLSRLSLCCLDHRLLR